METMIKKLWASSLALVGGVMSFALSAGAAGAQDYPQRPITIVVGAAAGGSSDTAARVIADRMSAILGQQVVIENVPGAGGMTGSARVARAEPDGYTLLMQQIGLVTLPALYPKLTFDVEKDLTAVGLVNTTYSFLVGRKSLPANNWAEVKAWMNGPGKPAKVAHPGAGTLGHLTAVLLGKAAGVDVNLIPYRGVGPAMNDLVGEHVDLTFGSSPVAIPLINSGAIKVYAFGDTKPHTAMPNVPAFSQVGHPELSTPFWHALFVPAATPPAIINKLNAALRETLADPQVKKAYQDKDIEVFPPDQLTPQAANAYVREELQRWGKVIRDNNIKVDQ
jgi:tripartite-type tricarboxylate transporter receptor subunit TctC